MTLVPDSFRLVSPKKVCVPTMGSASTKRISAAPAGGVPEVPKLSEPAAAHDQSALPILAVPPEIATVALAKAMMPLPP